MGSHFKEVEKALYQLGETGVIPSDEYRKKANELAHNLIEFLRKKGKETKEFSVAEPYIGGSYGKKTSCENPDLDITIRVNNALPPYGSILEKFEKHLRENRRVLKIMKNSIDRKTNSINFKFTCGIEVDLLVGANIPTAEILRLVAKEPKNSYSYNPSFVHDQIQFMRSFKSNLAHCLVRLLKFCFNSLGYGYNGSFVELVAVAAAEAEERSPLYGGKALMVAALERALEMISRVRNLQLAFKKTNDGRWTRAEPITSALVPDVIGSEKILRRQRFIIVPPNVNYDLLYDKQEDFFRSLMSFSNEMKSRLRYAMQGSYRNKDGSFDVIEMLQKSDQ